MIFKEWARKYWEQNLSVIPCMGKRPIIQGWTQFCARLSYEEEISEWERLYPRANIGLCLGQASGLVCLDIDREILELKEAGLPKSPISRRGQKGEARFFKYEQGLESRTFKNARIDFLSMGRQVIIPPSIHPDTQNAYYWLSTSNFQEAPEFPQDALNLLERLDSNPSFTGITSGQASPGRNNHLKTVACVMFTRGETFDAVLEEILDEDSKFPIPLFSDRSEGMSGNPRANAIKFVSSIYTFLTKNGHLEGVVSSPQVAIVPVKEQKQESICIPQSGLLKMMYDWQVDIANDELPGIFLGGALATLSAAVGNKFTFGGVSPNLYVLNIARTGRGKSWPYRLISEFLGGYDIVGPRSHKSSSSCVKGFGDRPWRTRIDPLDEVGGMLGLMKNGGGFQTELVNVFCDLWSCAGKFYSGIGYASQESTDQTACWHPYHVALCSTTPENLKTTYVRQWTDMGFLPRFLIFVDTADSPGWKKRGSGETEREFIQDAIRRVMSMEIELEDVRSGIRLKGMRSAAKISRFVSRELQSGPGVEDYLDDLEREYRQKLWNFDKDSVDGLGAAFRSRHIEQIKKIAAIHAISECLDETTHVYIESVEWARAVVEAQFKLAQNLLEDIHVSNFWVEALMVARKAICRSSRVTRAELSRIFSKKGWNSEILDKALKQLIENEEVIETIELPVGGKRGRRVRVYIAALGEASFAESPEGSPIVLGEA